MGPGAKDPMPRQNTHLGDQHLYSNGELGIQNHGYDTDPDYLGESQTDDVIVPSGTLVSAHGIKDTGLYLGMDKCSRPPTTISRNSLDLSSAAVKYSKGPDYEELNLPYVDSKHDTDLIGYSTIDYDTGIASMAPSIDLNGGISKTDGKHLSHQRYGNFSTAKRRSNPLYATDMSVTGYRDRKSSATTCCSWVVQVICLLSSALAIVLAVIALSERREMNTRYEELSRRYEELQSSSEVNNSVASSGTLATYDNLLQQLSYNTSQLQSTINDLKLTVQSLQTVLSKNVTPVVDYLKNQTNLLKTENANVTTAINFLRQDLTNQINQIPHGLANFSSCSHGVKTSGTSSFAPITRTESLNLNNSVVLSVVCSSIGGTDALLDYDSNSPNTYTCTCRGQTNSTVTSRYCIIHYWTCPVIP